MEVDTADGDAADRLDGQLVRLDTQEAGNRRKDVLAYRVLAATAMNDKLLIRARWRVVERHVLYVAKERVAAGRDDGRALLRRGPDRVEALVAKLVLVVKDAHAVLGLAVHGANDLVRGDVALVPHDLDRDR